MPEYNFISKPLDKETLDRLSREFDRRHAMGKPFGLHAHAAKGDDGQLEDVIHVYTDPNTEKERPVEVITQEQMSVDLPKDTPLEP